MPFTFRKRLKFGPFYVNVGKSGLTSWGVKVGAWSHNFTHGRTSVDLPGPVNYRSRGRKRP